MEYGKLIRDAWAITWRYRFLWILGVLGGGTVGVPALNEGGGGGPSVRTAPIGVEQANPALARAAQDVSAWVRTHVGESLLTWLVNVGLALACGIVCVAGVLGALVVLAGVGALVFAAAGLTAPTFGYVGIGALVFLAGVLTLVGIANTFFWTYWTLAYLQLTGRGAIAR